MRVFVYAGIGASLLASSPAAASPAEMTVDEGLAAQGAARGIGSMDFCGNHTLVASQEAELDRFFASHTRAGRQVKGDIEGLVAMDLMAMADQHGGKAKACSQIMMVKGMVLDSIRKNLVALRARHAKAAH